MSVDKTRLDRNKFQLRMPPGVYAEVKRRAIQNGRSMTAEINQIIAHALNLPEEDQYPAGIPNGDIMLDRIAFAILPVVYAKTYEPPQQADAPAQAIQAAYGIAHDMLKARDALLNT